MILAEVIDLVKALTVEQVAERLQVPENTVRKWFRNGVLPAIKIGRHWRMSEDALDKIIAGEVDLGAGSDSEKKKD